MKRYPGFGFAVALCAMLLYISPLSASAHMLPPFANGQPVPTLAPMIKRVTPAVVNVSTRGHVNVQANPFFNDPFFQQFFGNQGPQQMQRQFQSLGSGVIVDAEKGYILTNNHVVENADQITVTLNDNRSFKAKVVGTDPDTDIAVLKIDAKDLTAIPLGDSSRLQVGDFVVAIGNPFGLNHSVTAGIVSAKGRGRNQVGDGKYEDFIQTDASINPGNSGGALVDLQGNLVGINTAILSRSGGNIGIGFAIPIDMAKTVMEQLIKYGKVERGVVGVSVENLSPDLARHLGINASSGAIVTQVVPGSEAEKAGIKPNDVITSVNGSPVTGSADVSNTIGLMRIGSKVKLGILRDGKPMTITATIGKRQTESLSEKDHPELRGLSVANLDAGSPLYGQVKGVQVTGVERDSDAYLAGLRPGDVITAVNRTPISNTEEFRKALSKTKGGVALRVQRQDQVFYIVLQ
ncbi:MAG TPA: DegQ family serine endoprotease [Gammaproteobacteria bacterium]